MGAKSDLWTPSPYHALLYDTMKCGDKSGVENGLLQGEGSERPSLWTPFATPTPFAIVPTRYDDKSWGRK